MTKQRLPGTVPLLDWMSAWLEDHHKDGEPWPDRAETRQAMGNDLPRRFMPSLDGLANAWWTRTFQNGTTELGWRPYKMQEDEPALIVEELKLPLEGILSVITGDLVRARNDIGSARERLLAWAEAHPDVALDVDRAFDEIRQVVGL